LDGADVNVVGREAVLELGLSVPRANAVCVPLKNPEGLRFTIT
jgi:hypothetical protein